MKNRKSIRRQGHDYRSGSYLVTVCVRNRESLLGEIVDGEFLPSPMGRIVEDEWRALPHRFLAVQVDAYVVMPDHFHGIVTLAGAPLAGARAVDKSVGLDDRDKTIALDGMDDRAGLDAVDEPLALDGRDGDRHGDQIAAGLGCASGRAGASPAPALGTVVAAFKSLSDRRCREIFVAAHPDQRFGRLWQRNYHDRIIRDAVDLARCRDYVRRNPEGG